MLLAGELVIPVKAIMVGVAFKKLMKAGGGLVVSVLANEPSLNPALSSVFLLNHIRK